MIKIVLGKHLGFEIVKEIHPPSMQDVCDGYVKDEDIFMYFPEVYLHDDVFAKLFRKVLLKYKERKQNINIMTHSSVVLSTLGQAIILNVLKPEDIEIKVCEEYVKVNPKFDNNGDLSGWPIGYLNPGIWRL